MVSISITSSTNSVTATLHGDIVLSKVNYWQLYKNGVLAETKYDNTASVTFQIHETANYYVVASYTYNVTSYEDRYRKKSDGTFQTNYDENEEYALYSSWNVDSFTGEVVLGTYVEVLGYYLVNYIGYYTAGGKRISRVVSYDTYEYTQYSVERYQAEIITPHTEAIQSETIHVEYTSGKAYIYHNGDWRPATPYIYHNGDWVPATPNIYSGGWK